jgi:hypothetical protein
VLRIVEEKLIERPPSGVCWIYGSSASADSGGAVVSYGRGPSFRLDSAQIERRLAQCGRAAERGPVDVSVRFVVFRARFELPPPANPSYADYIVVADPARGEATLLQATSRTAESRRASGGYMSLQQLPQFFELNILPRLRRGVRWKARLAPDICARLRIAAAQAKSPGRRSPVGKEEAEERCGVSRAAWLYLRLSGARGSDEELARRARQEMSQEAAVAQVSAWLSAGRLLPPFVDVPQASLQSEADYASAATKVRQSSLSMVLYLEALAYRLERAAGGGLVCLHRFGSNSGRDALSA